MCLFSRLWNLRELHPPVLHRRWMLKKIVCSSLQKLKWPARGTGYQCVGSQEHICCVQVVWGGGGGRKVQLNSECSSVLALLCGLASTAAELDQLDSRSVILSHFCVWKGHLLLHHNYYIHTSSCPTAEGLNCRAGHVFLKYFPKKLHADQGLTDALAHIHQTCQKSSSASQRCQ